MADDQPIAEVGNVPPMRAPEDRERIIENLRAAYRERLGLPLDAPVSWVEGDVPGTGYLFQPGTMIRLDGGELSYTTWGYVRLRWTVRARRAWGWLRYGWRWWE
jgi:hypothetical protein